MSDWKEELEDRAFFALDARRYAFLTKSIQRLQRGRPNYVSELCAELKRLLQEHGVESEVSGRIKTLSSISRKMENERKNFEDISDISAFRIITRTREDCYRVLGLLHENYRFAMDRFDDYISCPKQNGYQSLHTRVIGPRAEKIEIQIRTHAMHEIAENGLAAHLGL